jgi:hypothetical protein
VKCTICEAPLDDVGLVLTYVDAAATYTATVHFRCLSDRVGQANARKLRTLAFDSGWRQTGLPGLEAPAPSRSRSLA